MEQLRKSIIKQEEIKMNNKLILLQKSIGHPLNELLDEEFINKISEDSFIWQVLSNKYYMMKGHKPTKKEFQSQRLYEEITYSEFVNECLSAILFFHLLIMDFKINLRIVADAVQTLKKQIQILKENEKIKFDSPNRLQISYIRHKSLKTEIFNYYKLKYKVAMNQQEQKSIYVFGDEMVCYFPILPDSDTLFFTVMGKRIDGGQKFEVLSKMEMSLDEVLVSIDLKTYSKEHIKPCILTIDYRDDSSDAPYDGMNSIELRFQLQMPSDQRITLMEGLLERQQKVEQQYLDQIELKNNSIQQIISPYENVVYIKGEDLKHVDETVDREFCSGCQIF